MKTMQQRRAEYALVKVIDISGDATAEKPRAPFADNFKPCVQALPAMIHMNGLGQAAAFYRAKANGTDVQAQAYGAAYSVLSGWLTSEGQPYHGDAYGRDLLKGITRGDMHRYRLAQAEAMALMEWVKRFAEAFIEEPPGGGAS